MAFVNYNNKEITVKIVYYGPALSGKTTCLQYTYNSKEYKKKGKLITLDTDGDRTLFFDFLPIEIGKLGDYAIKMQLYTVPGQVAYDTTRKLVLQGSDGVVFVADSQVVMREQNISSLKNLRENLKANKISFAEIPLILQYNKRDLREILPVEVLNRDLNPDNKPFFATIGTTGDNVLEALHTIMKMVIIYLKNKLTVFQKDKTVMFSREEATDTIIAPRGAGAGVGVKPPITKEAVMPDRANEDTEKEDLFELSSPMPLEEESLKTHDYHQGQHEQDEEIFNLGDDSMMGADEDSLEIPEANLRDELGEIREEPKRRIFETQPGPIAQSPDMDMKNKQRPAIYTQPSTGVAAVDKIIEVPLNILIPEDKDEIKINLNLQIVIKRQ
ncbi:MAG: GTPase domain-containing protein [Candidatus Aminicenantes bacterium]|nr:GTPase domain-containing protein [Candidatus Aminicenantes bacterium]